MTPELLTAQEVSRLLKVSRPLVYRWANEGRLACVRWNCDGQGQKKKQSIVRFKKCDILAFVDQNYHREHETL